MTVVIKRSVIQPLDEFSRLSDLEEFIAEARAAFGERADTLIGVVGDQHGVRLFTEENE